MIESNATNRCDGLALLSKMPAESVHSAFFDPQYRGILDKLAYGNEKTGKQARRAALTQMPVNTIKKFIAKIDRVLLPSAYLFLWLDKYEICQGSIKNWLRGTSLCLVDMIVWNKGHIGLGQRSRRTSEFLLVLQKPPKTVKNWRDHSIADVWEEKLPTVAELKKQGVLQAGETVHPHRKPVQLQKRLLLAVTNEGNTVIDCAAGSYGVLDICKETNRRCVTCDIEFGATWDIEKNIHK